jgi:mannosyl-oligosaccharide alpha-1,2-mannosidase
MPAFNSPSGIPYGLVNLKSGKTGNLRWTNHRAILSEIGSVQLEFKTLS